jgi:hypothetical protein
MKRFALQLIAAVLPFAASFALPPYEEPPTVRATDLVPASILSGLGYTVDPTVPTDGFVGIFRLHSDFGDFECGGREMLYTRIDEIRALQELERISRTKAFVDAMAAAAEEPVKSAAKIVTHPVKSVIDAPAGVARFFGKIVSGAGDAGKGFAHLVKGGDTKPGQPKPPPSREDPIGYNSARNVWAKKLRVDPYTTNRVLAVKLNHLAMISFGTDKVAGAGVGTALGGLGVVAEWLSWLPDLDEHVLTAPPADVTAINARKLASLGISKPEMKPLLDNPWMSPPLQSRFVNGLVRLKGARNAAAIVGLTSVVESEEQARFLCRSLEMLAHYDAKVAKVRELRAYFGVPAGVTADGVMVVAAGVDLLSWTKLAADFAAGRDPAGKSVLLVTGPLTKRAREGFAAQGWRVDESAPPS